MLAAVLSLNNVTLLCTGRRLPGNLHIDMGILHRWQEGKFFENLNFFLLAFFLLILGWEEARDKCLQKCTEIQENLPA